MTEWGEFDIDAEREQIHRENAALRGGNVWELLPAYFGNDGIQCPCCSGKDEGIFNDLCDQCAAAALAGQFPHECARSTG